jgi:SAM-dependent methyltransferase
MGNKLISREVIADSYLCGTGIEIGALHNPLRVPNDAHVKYVDRLCVEELRKHYPELNNVDLVPVDILADGERLQTIGDRTQDFVIANHFIEHCANPILAMENMLRVLKSGGILYIALPDKRQCFDVGRSETSFEHLLKDYREGPAGSRRAHFEEWSRLVNKVTDHNDVEKQVLSLMEMDYSIHYHVFTPKTMMEFIVGIRSVLDFPFECELFFRNESEVIIILRRE